MAVATIKAAAAALRRRFVGTFGGDEQVLREVFNVIEARGDVRHLRPLLSRGRSAVSWSRTWADNVPDQRRFWQSAGHSAPDGRTPLSSALLATPRLAVLARHRGDAKALRAFAKASRLTLAGMSAARASALDAAVADDDGALADCARAALADWRGAALATLLPIGGAELASRADASGRTALHVAAAFGESQGSRLLLRCCGGAAATIAAARARDGFGRTAAHVAAAHGHGELAEELAAEAGAETADWKDAFGRTFAETLAAREGGTLAEMSGGLSAQRLFADYVALGRPLIVRGGANHVPAVTRWRDPGLLERTLGGQQLSVGLVPYASRGETCTLGAFMASQGRGGGGAGDPRARERGKAQVEPRPYLFDVTIGLRCPQILADTELLPAEVLSAKAAYVRLPQLGIGFAGAGAPMHTHHAALNALFVGRKRWFLAPPRSAFWTFKPSAEWAASAHCERLRAEGELVEVTQNAGDLVFVPEGWGHATLLEEYCVGVGQEFIPNTSMSS